MKNKEVGEEIKLIARRLKRARIEKKLTQLELSLQSGVSQNMIALIETGKRNPTFQTIIKLCRALDVRLSDILQDVEPTAKTDDTDRRNAIKKEILNSLEAIRSLIEEL